MLSQTKTCAVITTAALFVTMFAPTPARAQSMAELRRGKIHVSSKKVPGSDVPRAYVKAVIYASPEKVWQVVSDCSKYKTRMNRIAKARLVKQSAWTQQGTKKRQTVVCDVTIDMPFPLSNLFGRTRATHTVEPGKKWVRSWKLIRGDYKFNTGSWTLESIANGTRTLVTYSVHAEPTTAVPDWVREKAQASTLPKMIHRLRQEALKIK